VARRGGEAALKRAREKARLEKQEAKREKRQARASAPVPEVNVDALMEEYASLSARHEAGQITAARFNEERQRIFEALGIESKDN
jgi:hypothetical protein